MSSRRIRSFEKLLSDLGYLESLKAFDLMREEMCAEKGFKRHNGDHYYYHLVDVTQILLNFGIRDEITITSALLHDFIEDVNWANHTVVKSMFGKEVADVVQILSKNPDIDYKTDIEEKKLYILGCMETLRTALIKAADRMHNFGTLLDASPEKKLRQALETEEFFIPAFEECAELYPRHWAFFMFVKTSIEPHLWEIKEHYKEVLYFKNEIKILNDKLLSSK